MVVATVLYAALDLEGRGDDRLGPSAGSRAGLPSFTAPDLSLAQVITLLGPAFTIAMLGAIESLLSAVVADGMAGTRPRFQPGADRPGPRQHRRAAVRRIRRDRRDRGARRPTSATARPAPSPAWCNALTLVSVLLFLAPLAADIPLAALSAILFVVAWNMSEVRHFSHIPHARADGRSRVLRHHFPADGVRRPRRPRQRRRDPRGAALHAAHGGIGRGRSEWRPASCRPNLREAGFGDLPAGVVVYEITGPMFFGAVENLERALLQTHTDPAALVIRLRRVPFIGHHRHPEPAGSHRGVAAPRRQGARLRGQCRVRGKLVKAGCSKRCRPRTA